MKNTKQQGLHPSQKRYLERRVAFYFLFVSILENPDQPPGALTAESQAPRKTKKKALTPSLQPTSPPVELAVAQDEVQSEDQTHDTDTAQDNSRESIDAKDWYADVLSQVEPRPEKHNESDLPTPGLQKNFIARLITKLLPNRGARRAITAAFGLIALVVVVQLIYPSNRALPLSRLETKGYLGFADERQILQSFEDFDARTVTVHTHSKNLTTSYKDLGVTVSPDKTIETMTQYSLRDRLLPFSLLVKGNKTYKISRDLNQSQLDLYVKDLINQANKQPADAVVIKQGTQLVITPSEEGFEYQGEVLRSQLLRSDLADKEQIVFAPTILPPNISTETAKNIVTRMQQRIDAPLLISAEAQTFRVDSAIMASWVDIIPQPQNKTVDIVFNRERVAATLKPFAQTVDYNPVPTIVTLLNGVPAGRTEGSVGKSLQFDQLVDRVLATTSPSIATLESTVVTLPPPEQIDRRYSKDSQGMQTMLSYWVTNHAGEYSIDVQTVNGRISASINPHQIRSSIGVYRVYIASQVYGRIASNTIGLSSVLQNGQTVSVCLDRMLRESDESCSSALGSLVGWGANDEQLKAQGFDGTTLTEGAGLTTASNLTQWFLKVNSGTIATKLHASSLFQTMSRESNRSGIPAGSQGMFVANKSGSSGRFKHDSAIVYHPRDTYVLSVMSEGSSFANIADLANEVNKILSQ